MRVCGNLPVCVTLSSHPAKNSWTLHEELSNHKAAKQLLKSGLVVISYSFDSFLFFAFKFHSIEPFSGAS